MPCVANGLYVVQGEMAILLAAMRRGTRWSTHTAQDYNQDALVQSFNDLKDILNQLGDLKELDPSHYFGPFLEVIRAGGTTGPVTSLALSAVQKFLSYGLIDGNNKTAASTLENIADAVTHTKFVSTDQNSDGVVLLKILQVLRTVVLSPLGALLTHESMCEIMLSCFRICFEHRLTEHIRKSAEFCLKDIVQHLFTRLPEFAEDFGSSNHVKKIRMNKGSVDSSGKQKKEQKKKVTLGPPSPPITSNEVPLHDNIVDMQGDIHRESQVDGVETDDASGTQSSDEVKADLPAETQVEGVDVETNEKDKEAALPEASSPPPPSSQPSTAPVSPIDSKDYINLQGVRFTSSLTESELDNSGRLVAYGLGWIRELFRFLVSLCNPLDKMNTEMMIHIGLTLLEVAFEVGCDSIGRYSSLLTLVKDELCRNLFSLLQSDRLSIFALDIQVCFLVFESLRTHLKFQLENFLTRLMDMIVSDSVKISFEQKEIALEAIVQLWRIPGLVTELYLNYDCDLYCPNIFEDVTKLLSKNAFPVTGIYSTHLLSLDALLTIIDSIEEHCHNRILSDPQSSGIDAPLLPTGRDRPTRHPICPSIPSHEELMALKRKKKLLNSGTEQFNAKPKKGIQFLQEHHLLKPQLDPHEVVYFLRENPRLDKKMIGDYISNRSNIEILDAFVKSFDFCDMRIDEALRLYLETFRLPGESPLIAIIMEHFADHWHKSNSEPFANADAAFTLAYAVIMLNVDQHNYNVKRQNSPMTPDEFKKNLKAVNGGKDFDQDMLDEIYNSIKLEEIVMPAEQSGLVKENYLWKVLLRRGTSKDGVYLHAPNGLYDHDLFSLIWSPTIAALSFVFDKSNDPTIYSKAISGFRKCAMIAAHYGMSSDFDNLVISLSKFSCLTNSMEPPDQLAISFGSNTKAQLAAKTLFHLAHRHGEILREGWTNVLDTILVLYRCQLLPKCLLEAEDFLEAGGKIQLCMEEAPIQKAETGLLSSLYSYIALGEGGKVQSSEEQEAVRLARQCVKECRVEQLITESKYMRVDALTEFVKALIAACPELSSPTKSNNDATIFFLELLLKVIIENKDRSGPVWPLVRDHLYSLMMAGSACENHFLTERAIVGLLRLAIRLMRSEELSPIVLQSLRLLLLLKPTTLQRVSRQVAYGLNDLIKTSAANIHTTTDWTIIFTLLECVGAGSPPPRVVGDPADPGSIPPWAFAPPVTREKRYQVVGETKSDGDMHSGTEDSGLGVDRGYTSEPEPIRGDGNRTRHATGGWILVGRAGELQPLHTRGLIDFELDADLQTHDPFSLVKCCETLAFLIRDVAHITPFNYRVCVQCIRLFVEASLNCHKKPDKRVTTIVKDGKSRKKVAKKREGRSPQLSPTTAYDADESDSEEVPGGYHQITIQLLDLMHTLHTRTAQIHRWWAEEGEARSDIGSLWQHGWCPLLQGIARICCDSRKQVRMTAITYLQRALLVHDLQTLTADEWASCFNQVLFPLLTKLLELRVTDEVNLEETRVRAATVLSKVFLHHLTPLLSLPTFSELWLRILDLMDKYIHVERSDLLQEAIPESLKNMLLVMDSAQVFVSAESAQPLWQLTWDRISTFLPDLKDDFYKAQSSVPKHEELPQPTEQDENITKSVDDITQRVGLVEVEPATNQHQSVQVLSLEEGGQHPVPVNLISYPVLASPEFDTNLQYPTKPTSIILQPPTYGASYTTPIFNHAGQQMLTTVLAANPVTLVPHQPESAYVIPMTPTQDSAAYSSPVLPKSPSEEFAQPLPELQSEPLHPIPTCPTQDTVYPLPVPVVSSPTLPSEDNQPTSPPRFGSHNSAFVPYVNPNTLEISAPSPKLPGPSLHSRISAPGRPVYYGQNSNPTSPERRLATPSSENIDVEPHNNCPESTICSDVNNQDNSPPPLSSVGQNSFPIPSLDNAHFYIPAPSNITAPVQMFAGSHVVPTVNNSLPTALNNNFEPVVAASALSQYFNASYQSQQQEAFDNLLASATVPKSTPAD